MNPRVLTAAMVFVVVWVFCRIAFASGSPPISKGEFLAAINDGSLVMDGRQPFYDPSSEFVKQQMKKIKMMVPEFNESMYGIFYKIRSGYQYSVGYNWMSRECLFEINKLTDSGEIDVKVGSIDKSVIPVRICEKLFQFKSR